MNKEKADALVNDGLRLAERMMRDSWASGNDVAWKEGHDALKAFLREEFAVAVTEERERCARLCEAPSSEDLDHNETGSIWDSMACAMAIRRRRA